ncbi:hypothetical protein EIP86_000051 [Pleurotus ostreatoroseus]|nr:hypothetical protein EIP86_000051 [Pleurotus ostreatoroseus]
MAQWWWSSILKRTRAAVHMTTIVTPILTDAIVVFVTWYSTFRQVKEAAALGLNMGFSGVLLRDVCSIKQNSPPLGIASTFAFFLRPVLIVRFLINLRYVDAASPSTDLCVGIESQRPTQTQTNFSSPRFRTISAVSVLGNMGASMDYTAANDGEGYSEGEEEQV